LSVLAAFPVFTIPGTNGVKKWNPAVLQYDLGSDFGGGYYAYYYPQGVISKTEYEQNEQGLLAAKEQADKAVKDAEAAYYGSTTEEDKPALKDALDKATQKAEACDAEWREYTSAYKLYKSYDSNTSLYFSTNPEDGIFMDYPECKSVSYGFKTAFEEAYDLVCERFAARAAKTGSDYSVSVVDDYAIRVQISSGEVSEEMNSSDYASQAFSLFGLTDKLYFMQGDTVVDQLSGEDSDIKDLIKKVKVTVKYEVAQIHITFTSKGKDMLDDYLDAAKADSSLKLSLTVGKGENKTTLMEITSDSINTKDEVQQGVCYEEEKLYAETLCVLINSAMENGGVFMNDNEVTPFAFATGTTVRVYNPVQGEVYVGVLIAVFAVLVLVLAYAIWKMGGFGWVNLYTTLSYFVIVALCYAFISGGVFVVSYGSILVFLAGLALTNALNMYIYNAIVKEVALGKTVVSSVKNGYKKTLSGIADLYVVTLLGALALLIGAAGLNTIALQAIICVVAAAFCNLLWGRVINVMLLSASKDKYKYFRLVREDDDDE
jgi:hypothetical protein